MSETKKIPENAKQHVTAGPYSPVLEVEFSKLVLISGQAPLDLAGNIIGSTIEEQTRVTLKNCATQLSYAGCTLADVFKVNVFITDLANWERFNKVYVEMIPEPRPVRTCVGTALLDGFLVEIEMWAAKK
jgi:2-iminobutanoate/2-iminopropanoate deaminase